MLHKAIYDLLIYIKNKRKERNMRIDILFIIDHKLVCFNGKCIKNLIH